MGRRDLGAPAGAGAGRVAPPALGLTSTDRWAEPRPPAPTKARAARAAAASASTFVPIDKTFLAPQGARGGVGLRQRGGAALRRAGLAAALSLLHGAIYGVPVAGEAPIDRRPAAEAVSLALGLHDDDLLAAFAAAQAARPAPRHRTAAHRLHPQKVNRLGAADGAVELEEHEHAIAFASLPAGSASTDRFLQRVQTGGTGGLGLAGSAPNMWASRRRPRRAGACSARRRRPRRAWQVQTHFSSKGKPDLIKATGDHDQRPRPLARRRGARAHRGARGRSAGAALHLPHRADDRAARRRPQPAPRPRRAWLGRRQAELPLAHARRSTRSTA